MRKGKNGTVRVGCGSPDAESRLNMGIELAKYGELDYLSLDTLSERTLPAAQMRRRQDPHAGYDARAKTMFSDMLSACVANDVTMIGNMGGANPQAAFELALTMAKAAGHEGLRVAVITGDDVLDQIRRLDPVLSIANLPLSQVPGEVVSANAYIGADPIVSALDSGAQLVIGGRIADPSLFLAPLMFEFGWSNTDWHLLGAGQMVGHLLECGHHATGGNMSDPPYRVIPGLSRLGLPFGEVQANGDWVMTKLPTTGGVVDVLNCKAQLFHEVHDPARYLTPDVTADFTQVEFRQVGKDRVFGTGATGRERPNELKVLVGIMEGFIGEGEMTFAGPGALNRAELAREFMRERIAEDEPKFEEVRFDFIGVNSTFGDAAPPPACEPNEVRFRFAARTRDRNAAEWVTKEMHSLFFGPASGGGRRDGVREVLGMYTTFLPRDQVSLDVQIEEVQG